MTIFILCFQMAWLPFPPPPVTCRKVAKGGKATEAVKEGTIAAAGEASKEGTPAADPR